VAVIVDGVVTVFVGIALAVTSGVFIAVIAEVSEVYEPVFCILLLT
jgi:hypothetical protein